MRYIRIEQIGSPIRRPGNQRETLIGLRLNKIGRLSSVPDTPAQRGMIARVSHLVRIIHDPSARPRVPADQEDAADAALVRKLAFEPNNVVSETYSVSERARGKTPDFKLLVDGKLRGFCELKSPRDDQVLKAPDPGRPAIRKNLPFYRKLGDLVRSAASQLDAVNPEHTLPNIVAFVSHTPDIARRDLMATIAGLPIPGSDRRVYLLGHKMQRQVMEAARHVDLFIWIDAKTGTYQHLSVNGAPHQAAALDLLGLKNKE